MLKLWKQLEDYMSQSSFNKEVDWFLIVSLKKSWLLQVKSDPINLSPLLAPNLFYSKTTVSIAQHLPELVNRLFEF